MQCQTLTERVMSLTKQRVCSRERLYAGKICDCLYTEMDMCEWYVDKYGDLRADAVHHDGRNYYLYRVYKDTVLSGTTMDMDSVS